MVARRCIAKTSNLLHDASVGALTVHRTMRVFNLARRAVRAYLAAGVARNNTAKRELGER
jgi:hypothetical protein